VVDLLLSVLKEYEMKMMKKQKGFTLVELMIVIASLFSLVIGAVALFIAFHFIAKVW
jgi:type II secretory pathway component PulJ